MKDVDLKYQISKKEYYNWKYSIVSAGWTNHYFGYTCYLPQDIYIEDVNMLGFSVKVDSKTGERTETIDRVNVDEIYLFTSTIYTYTHVDLSDPDAKMTVDTNDWKQCTCATRPDSDFKGTIRKYFYDSDGDGRCNNSVRGESNQSVWCWGYKEKPDTTVNANPYIGTKNVTVVNEDPTKPLKVIWPMTPQFKDMTVTVDNVVVIKNGKKVD